MNDKTIFADTYAIFEILRKNPNYDKYADYEFLVTKYNLMELYYNLVKEGQKNLAYNFLIKVAKSLIPINLGNIRGGMKFKLKYKKEHLSYVDCIGWAKAKELGIKFLTGDEKFEDKDNVEFVK